MVAPHHVRRLPRPRAASLAHATLCVLGLLALTASALPGCQQRARFAQGGEAMTPVGYPDRRVEHEPAAPTSTTSTDIPAPPLATSSFPASWSPQARSRPWRWIVIHHSATFDGGAARFDRQHRNNGWDELGYHFVIGNGSDTRDGLIEVGPRWTKQKHGAHAKTPDNRFNDYGIGICLVGNFDTSRPSEQQLRALATVVAYLMQKYDIPASRVIGHDDTGRSTACPGRYLEAQLPGVRRLAARAVANGFAADVRPAPPFASDTR